MAVTLAATERQAEPLRADGIHAVDHILDTGLLRVTTALAIGHVIAMETGRELLIRSSVWQEIARKLLNRELVIRHVHIERSNDPIPPRPVRARLIGLVTIRIRVSRTIQPHHGHALAVVR